MDAQQALEFARTNHRAVLHTFRADGTPQLSPIAVGVLDDTLAVSTRETAMRPRTWPVIRERPC